MRGGQRRLSRDWDEVGAKLERRGEAKDVSCELGGLFKRRKCAKKKLDIDEAGPKYYGIGLLVGVYVVRFGYCPSLG